MFRPVEWLSAAIARIIAGLVVNGSLFANQSRITRTITVRTARAKRGLCFRNEWIWEYSVELQFYIAVIPKIELKAASASVENACVLSFLVLDGGG